MNEDLPKEVTEFFDSRGEKLPSGDTPPADPPAEPKGEDSPAPPPPANEKPPVDKQALPPKDPQEVERENLKKALDEERTRRKEIADRLKAEAEKRAELESKFNSFMKQLEEQNKPKPPSYEEDPAGNLKALLEQEMAKRKELEDKLGSFEKTTQERTQMEQFTSILRAATVQFMQTAPDYPDAYKHVREIRTKELIDLGVDPQVAEQEINKWELHISAVALQNGRNPAEVLYRQAQTLGYKKGATNTPPPPPEPNKQIERLAKGQEAAATLGAGRADQPLSLEKLAEMDEDQLAEFVKSSNWNKLARMI